ncbi:MAG: hypothetical protein KGZ39_03350, partial [Simkania sp.]|nr:hypothetical protein [Simkania sp.]
MSSNIPLINQTAISGFPIDLVQQHIADYIAARDAFDSMGGQAFIADRRKVRAVYCNSAITPESPILRGWISTLPTQDVQEEFTRRIGEWDSKIAQNILARSGTPTISDDQFLKEVQAYYDKHAEFLNSPFFSKFTTAKANLRNDILPEL